MQQDFWYAYLKLLLPGELTRLSDKFMEICIHGSNKDKCYICNRNRRIDQIQNEMLHQLYQQQPMGQPNMQQTQKPKEPKSRECWMVQCLFEEIMKHSHKFSEMDTGYIKDLNTKFFNDPEYKLSEKQIKWLDIIWEK